MTASKTGKALGKSLLNLARCERWNREAGRVISFMSGEGLTTRAGVSVQQDLALVALLGLTHVERNGHHCVDGMAAPESERLAFLAAHPDRYQTRDGGVRLRVERGRLSIGSLGGPGVRGRREPDRAAMREVAK